VGGTEREEWSCVGAHETTWWEGGRMRCSCCVSVVGMRRGTRGGGGGGRWGGGVGTGVAGLTCVV